jgi:tetratricopeptide (TPR) repeat protein
MKNKALVQIVAFLLLPFLTFSQTQDNAELKKMYDEDQGARSVPQIDWNQLSKQDSLREIRNYELIKAGQLKTGKDYYHSAMLFQHGQDSIAYGMAVKHMKKAIEMDTTVNRWLLAAAIDRELNSRNKPQIYGTQYFRKDMKSKWELTSIDTTQITDKERMYYGVETLAEQRLKVKYMNLISIYDFYNESKSVRKTMQFIKNELKKGDKSIYAVNENAINNFGYQLLGQKNLKDALRIFKLNTELYPNGFNTFDSYGECLLALNKKEEGMKAYKKSLELNPKNENARKIIATMK